jgi:FAD/FMN-containing dehydrogenase
LNRVLAPSGLYELVGIVRAANAANAQISICGGRHAMGGQQFGANTWLVDMQRYAAFQQFDSKRGLVTAGAGIQWPELIAGCLAQQSASGPAWSIRQKQTGADRLSLGGALSANVHGRGLRLPPIIGDVEAFTLVQANGEACCCSRTENNDLFSLAIGGYGLFGIIADVTLRLMPRVKVERRVEVLTLDELVRVPAERDTNNWLFGDFQYSIDERSPDFLRRGVFSAYHRIAEDASMPAEQKQLREEDWGRLIFLAHTDRARAFKEYSDYYLTTDGQRYWSDTHQLSTYLDNYHAAIDRRLGALCPCSEMITEIYVPRVALTAFMDQAAEQLRHGRNPVIYGTIRLVERDGESFLAWAREPWACIIFNVHIEHTPAGLAKAGEAFRGLIDLAIAFGGSYYLTYHRWATRAQVEACHPRFREFLQLKRAHDPTERFTSDWYRHHQALFAGT